MSDELEPDVPDEVSPDADAAADADASSDVPVGADGEVIEPPPSTQQMAAAEITGDANPVRPASKSESELNVSLDVFEGPLDLLLYLIRKDEVDIYDIPIVNITAKYMEYINLMQILDLNVAGEFLVMASTLTLIKSRMLLPVDDRPELDEEDENDPRLDLVRQLVEYRKFKNAAEQLERMEEEQLNIFPRGEVHVDLEKEAGVSIRDVSIFDLINAFNEALKRVEQEHLHEIFTERYTVAEKIDDLMIRLRANESISVSRLFEGMRSRQEIICTFLAVLELMRLKQVTAKTQEGYFDEIVIQYAHDEEDDAPEEAP